MQINMLKNRNKETFRRNDIQQFQKCNSNVVNKITSLGYLILGDS